MSLKSKIAARKGSKPAAISGDEGDEQDVATDLANARRELAEARAKLGEIEREREGWRAKAEKAEGSLVTERINRALYSAASAAGAIDPDDVVELVRSKGARLDGDKVVFGQGAEAKDASAFVTSFVEGKPHLRKAAPVAQGSGSPATQAASSPAVQTPPKGKPDLRDPRAVAQHYRDELAAKLAASKSPKPAA